MPRLLIAALLFLVASSPRSAAACGCCDGGDTVTPLGFSERGSLLVVRDGVIACEPYRVLEVYRPSESAPSLCFDLLGPSPEAPVDCAAPHTHALDAFPAPVTADLAHPRRRFFPLAPQGVARALVRARSTPVPRTPDDTYGRPAELSLDLFLGGAFRTVAALRVTLNVKETELYDWIERDDSPDHRLRAYAAPGAPEWALPERAVEVMALRPPRGDHVIFLVKGDDHRPGTGHWATRVLAARVPGSGLSAPAPVPGPSASAALTPSWLAAIPSPGPAADGPTVRGTVARFHRYARMLRRAGHDDRAALWLARTLAVDPSNAPVRYDLARSMSRLGYLEAAIALLVELREMEGCLSCREWLRRATTEPDFEELRGNPRFADVTL